MRSSNNLENNAPSDTYWRVQLACMKLISEIPDSSRLEFLEKFLANSSALSDPEDSTSGLLNKEGKVDLLLLRTLLAIYQNRESQVSGKW